MKNLLNMKAIFLSLFVLLTVSSAFAQFDIDRPQAPAYRQYWTFGFHYGIAQFKGDVSSKGFFEKLKDESKPSFSINIGRQISPVFALKAEFGKSNLYSKSSIQYLGDSTVLSMKGDVNEVGLYGIFNLNNLFTKNRSADSKWNAYLSSGLGYAFWRARLRDEISNTIVDSVGYTGSGKTSRMKEMVFPVTLGLNFKLTDGIWLSLENSFRFVNSDKMDAYINNKTDWFTTTKIGLTFNLQKLSSGNSRKSVRVSTPKAKTSSVEPTYDFAATPKSSRRSIFRSTPRSSPELLDYTGYNQLIPPPIARNNSATNPNSSATTTEKKGENRWEDPNNPGQFEITGVYNKKTAVDTLEVKKIKHPIKFKPRTVRITRGFGPTGGSGRTRSEGNVITSKSATSSSVERVAPETFAPGTIYKIQIQASKENIPVESIAKKMNVSEPVTVEQRDGWYRYYVGSYTAYSAARQHLNHYRSKGIKDAFLCAFPDGVRKVIKN